MAGTYEINFVKKGPKGKIRKVKRIKIQDFERDLALLAGNAMVNAIRRHFPIVRIFLNYDIFAEEATREAKKYIEVIHESLGKG